MNLPIELFMSDEIKRSKELPLENFLSTPNATLRIINNLNDEETIKHNESIIAKNFKFTPDPDFLRLLTICSTANEKLLPTKKDVRNHLKKIKKNKK